MKRMLLLIASLACATPAAAQSSNRALEPLLVKWGFPPEALVVMLGSEADARRVLGAPAADRTYPNDFFGGPDYRELEYRLEDGRRLTLNVCTDHERTERGIRRPQVFCEMAVDYSSGRNWPSDTDMDRLQQAAERTFGECDSTYYVFDGLLVNVAWRPKGDDVRTVVTLEPFPRAGETMPAR